MKKTVLAAVLFASISLCACGGGGGGGGGGGVSHMTDSDVFSYVPPEGTTLDINGSGSGISVTKTSSGLRLKIADGTAMLEEPLWRTVNLRTGSNSDFRESGNYITAEKFTDRQLTNVFVEGFALDGQANIRDKIELGGKKLGLEFSEFGLWSVNIRLAGTVNGSQAPSDRFEIGGYAFHFGDDNYKRGFAANSGQASFTGRAIGQAWAEETDITQVVTVYGDAKLDMDMATLEGNLDLDFKNFYKFQMDVRANSQGVLSVPNNSSITSVTDTGNTTGINLSTNAADLQSYHLEGNLYGRNDSTEGVGYFDIEDLSHPGGEERGVFGAFGFKRKNP